MSVIDVAKLLAALSDESPCGPNLEYDPAVLDMTRVAQGKPEQVMGETVIPAQDPDWKGVKTRALEIVGRTKDLRVAALLAQALLKTDAWQGLLDGLEYIQGLVERYWEGVHPRLDPEEDNDPTWRVNILASLCGEDTFIKAIRETPLVEARQLGRFSLRDVLIATGKLAAAPVADRAQPTSQDIEAAFRAVPLEDLVGRHQAISSSIERTRALEALLTDRVGQSRAASFDDLVEALTAAGQPLAEALIRRGATVDGGVGAETAGGAPGAEAKAAGGEIATREDVIRALDRICEYFARHEPSSPIPILLQRAKRLVSKNFMDIVRDLAPGGVAEVETIRGVQE